jgi:gamma-glutamyl-gamma-aminobutyrate hydrolase PuuD
MKKPPSKKSAAAKAKREKITLGDAISDETRQRLEDAFERSYPSEDTEVPWDDPAFVQGNIKESDILTAEEVRAEEERILGKKGVPFDDGSKPFSPYNDDLNDDVPSFLHASAKAGPPRFPNELVDPPLDHLGRKRKPADVIALGETPSGSVIYAGAPKKEDAPRRAVTIMRDHDLEYPDLYLAVFVAPDWAEPEEAARFARLFARSGCYRADTIDEADLVVFGGGSDVEPLLYGEDNNNRHPTTYFNQERDAADIKLYLQARDLGIAMMGVCRGSQFLHVVNGGKLYQDIDGHHGPHKAFDVRNKQLLENVSSVHHQSCMYQPDAGMEVLLTSANTSNIRWINADVKEKKPTIDIEAFFYRDTGCFGVQGHPEYANYNRYSVWCLEQIRDLFLNSPDFGWDGDHFRMTAAARDAGQMANYVETAYSQAKEV